MATILCKKKEPRSKGRHVEEEEKEDDDKGEYTEEVMEEEEEEEEEETEKAPRSKHRHVEEEKETENAPHSKHRFAEVEDDDEEEYEETEEQEENERESIFKKKAPHSQHRFAEEEKDDNEEECDEETEEEEEEKENERAGTFKKKAPCSKAGCKRAIARKVVHDYFGTDIFRSGRATRPKNPYFVTKIRAKRRDQLYIPIDVVRDHKLELPSSMTIRDPADRKFGTKLKSWKDGKIWLHGGWHNLCTWNLVGKDDSCICEFVRGKGKKGLHLQRIPAWFLRHISEESPDKATLKCVSGGTWNVKLQCDEDGLLIHKGWEKFQKNNQLEEGDFLVFRYDGGLQFTVRFFSKNGLEREVKSTTMGKNQEVQVSNKTRNPKRPAKINKRTRLDGENGTEHETPRERAALEKAEDLLTPNIPQFVKCLKGYNVNNKIRNRSMSGPVSVPANRDRRALRISSQKFESQMLPECVDNIMSNITIAKISLEFVKHILKEAADISLLKGSCGKYWNITLSENEAGGLSFHGGWKQHLKKGDATTFHVDPLKGLAGIEPTLQHARAAFSVQALPQVYAPEDDIRRVRFEPATRRSQARASANTLASVDFIGRDKDFLHGVLETASHISAMYDRTGEDFRGIGSSFAAVQSVSSAVLLVLFTRQQVLVCISEQNFMK
ncbi:hypothetical protein RND71_000794 [Anisodus tanguticus]|uniref:TF-B3 domain-containing protein n=1 Tax=Anisodus tanguticus TaxID=243964 RepID=A0AAE1T144_9SOLA|nr:hypothetical protein RND71_000794 [Anisodus tanguticus]